ncbi:MAG: shikimate kinase [Pleomorphochaeta sp.]
MTYFFAGIKHSGKSTHARLFAEYKNLPFYDLDKYIEENINYPSVRALYKAEGKEAFMEQEYICLKKLLKENPQDKVIALGGGICENPKAFDLCDNLIFLDLDEEVLFKRINFLGLPPFLEGDPINKFHILYNKRRPLYKEKAKITIKLKDDNIDNIFEIVKKELINWEK